LLISLFRNRQLKEKEETVLFLNLCDSQFCTFGERE
jgi:hypothetical protein